MPMPQCAVALENLFQNGMVVPWQGTYESNTAALCKLNGKDTTYTFSGTAWERHGMYKLALSQPSLNKSEWSYTSGS
jgi:hypothetical protein